MQASTSAERPAAPARIAAALPINSDVILARAIRIVSVVASLILVASFAMFAIDQAGGASRGAQAEVGTGGGQTLGPPLRAGARHGQARRAIDGASDVLSAPFAALLPAGSSAWGVHGADLVGGLLLYGFGFGALSRAVALTRAHEPRPAAAHF